MQEKSRQASSLELLETNQYPACVPEHLRAFYPSASTSFVKNWMDYSCRAYPLIAPEWLLAVGLAYLSYEMLLRGGDTDVSMFLGVIGRSGSGKNSALKLLRMLIEHTVELDPESVRADSYLTPQIPQEHVCGTTQGIVAAIKDTNKAWPERDYKTAILVFPELVPLISHGAGYINFLLSLHDGHDSLESRTRINIEKNDQLTNPLGRVVTTVLMCATTGHFTSSLDRAVIDNGFLARPLWLLSTFKTTRSKSVGQRLIGSEAWFKHERQIADHKRDGFDRLESQNNFFTFFQAWRDRLPPLIPTDRFDDDTMMDHIEPILNETRRHFTAVQEDGTSRIMHHALNLTKIYTFDCWVQYRFDDIEEIPVSRDLCIRGAALASCSAQNAIQLSVDIGSRVDYSADARDRILTFVRQQGGKATLARITDRLRLAPDLVGSAIDFFVNEMHIGECVQEKASNGKKTTLFVLGAGDVQ